VCQCSEGQTAWWRPIVDGLYVAGLDT
jgi:hypothetical protein